jgi:hypothetical protein
MLGASPHHHAPPLPWTQDRVEKEADELRDSRLPRTRPGRASNDRCNVIALARYGPHTSTGGPLYGSHQALLDGQVAFHSRGRVARDGADIEQFARLERDRQRRALIRRDERRRLPADREIMRELALVLDFEDDRAVRDTRLGEREPELGRRNVIA